MKVTEEMMNAYNNQTGNMWVAPSREGLQNVLDLIEPIPDEVRTVRIEKNDEEFYRIMATDRHSDYVDTPTNVWRHECGCCFSTSAQLFERATDVNGEVSW